MKKRDALLLIIIGCLLIVLLAVFFGKITGNVVDDFNIGPSAEEQECMETCVVIGCETGDDDCMIANSEKCMAQCGAESEPQGEGEQCVQECVDKFCEKRPDYTDCMSKYAEECDDECGMKGDAPDESEMSAEQLCISNCVAKVNPEMRCGNSQEGEIGGSLCQRCADECLHLYEGPCLSDEQLTEKENECISKCEHCYGEPVMGDSGQGWDCIVDVECKDASEEFGDDAGQGPGIGDEGYVPENIVEEIADGIIGFFKGLFR